MLALPKVFRKEAGDTLIEVLFAMSIFSLIVVSSLALMNQGTAASRRSLDITLARQQMDAQAETLRFLQEAYVGAYEPGATTFAAGTPAAEYKKIIQFAIDGRRTAASKFGSETACATPESRDFVLNPVRATIVTTTGVFKEAKTFPQVTYTSDDTLDQSQGLWIEAVRSNTIVAGAGYIDFHIRACWDGDGTNAAMNLGTIVRLYEPRG